MLTRRFAVHLNRSLVGLLGIVIEKTDVAYLRSFPCVVVKRYFKLLAEIQKLKLIVFCREPVLQRIWTPRSKSASGYEPPFADLDPPTKLSF